MEARILSSSDEGTIFECPSSSSDFVHTVSWDSFDGWFCTCEDYFYRHSFCKHMKECKELAEKEGLPVDNKVFEGLSW